MYAYIWYILKIVIRTKKDDNLCVLKHRFKNIVNNNKKLKRIIII